MGLPVRPSGAGASKPTGSGAKPASAPSTSEQGGLPSMEDLALPFLGEEPGEAQDSYLHDLEDDPNLELPMLDFGDGATTQLELDEPESEHREPDSSDDFEFPEDTDELPEVSPTRATNTPSPVPGPPENDDDIFDKLLQKFDVDESDDAEDSVEPESSPTPAQSASPRRTPRSVAEVMNLDDDDFSFEDDHNAESSNGFSATSDLDELEIDDGAPSDDADWAAEFERMLDEKAPVSSEAERFPEPPAADDAPSDGDDDEDDENWFVNSEEEEPPEGFDSFGNPTAVFPDAPVNRPDSDTEVIDDPEEEPEADESEEGDDEGQEKPKRKSSGRKGGSKRGAGRVAKASTGLVRALTLIPFVGRFFKPLEKISRFFLPLLVVLLLVGIPMGLYTVALNSIANPTSITFPDEGSAKIGQFSFDKDTMTASGTITNTGDVIADVKPVFTIWTYHISADPRNWAAFKKVGTCEGAQVSVPIDGTKQVSVKCDVKGLDGFSQKASATLVY